MIVPLRGRPEFLPAGPGRAFRGLAVQHLPAEPGIAHQIPAVAEGGIGVVAGPGTHFAAAADDRIREALAVLAVCDDRVRKAPDLHELLPGVLHRLARMLVEVLHDPSGLAGLGSRRRGSGLRHERGRLVAGHGGRRNVQPVGVVDQEGHHHHQAGRDQEAVLLPLLSLSRGLEDLQELRFLLFHFRSLFVYTNALTRNYQVTLRLTPPYERTKGIFLRPINKITPQCDYSFI
jgi:hypothetical protein